MAKFSPLEFVRQVKSEAKKVSWPTRQETTVSTLAVFMMVLFASIFMFAADQIMAVVVHQILNFGM